MPTECNSVKDLPDIWPLSTQAVSRFTVTAGTYSSSVLYGQVFQTAPPLTSHTVKTGVPDFVPCHEDTPKIVVPSLMREIAGSMSYSLHPQRHVYTSQKSKNIQGTCA